MHDKGILDTAEATLVLACTCLNGKQRTSIALQTYLDVVVCVSRKPLNMQHQLVAAALQQPERRHPAHSKHQQAKSTAHWHDKSGDGLARLSNCSYRANHDRADTSFTADALTECRTASTAALG